MIFQGKQRAAQHNTNINFCISAIFETFILTRYQSNYGTFNKFGQFGGKNVVYVIVVYIHAMSIPVTLLAAAY